MKTIIFFNIPSHGHINPTLPLVKRLAKRGHRIIYYCFEEWREQLESLPVEFRAYQNIKYRHGDVQSGNFIHLARRLLEVSDPILQAHLEEVKRDDPDLIIHDSLCPWGKIMAHELKVKAVSSITTFVIGYKLIRKNPSMIFQRLRELFSINYVMFRRYARKLYLKYGIQFSLKEVFRNKEKRNVVYTSHFFQPYAQDLGKEFYFVGPSFENREGKSDFPFNQLNPNQTKILISLGTIMNERTDFYRECFKAFKDQEVQVILSIGNKVDSKSLGEIPENFIVRATVPQLELLKQVSLFISHGGMNSVNESLHEGVPLVLFPQQGEQKIVANRVVELGAGIVLKGKNPTAQQIHQVAMHVLENPDFKKNAEKIEKTLREAGGVERAVEVVEEQLLKR
ncbi:MAG: glycosyltransferase, MGT family [uncultured bacterium]|nr:MAG: glycosyltransferase, MGT family [uncultured bacterium]KKT74057.1 MAG: Glycosyltransferase, MGT family [Candidatus Peregrinibacteria bacterium GW2011_GWA2_44_7]